MLSFGASVPIVLVSGYGPEELLGKVDASLFDAFLTKPFLPNELCEMVDSLVAPRHGA